jgi:hypothetical protein
VALALLRVNIRVIIRISKVFSIILLSKSISRVILCNIILYRINLINCNVIMYFNRIDSIKYGNLHSLDCSAVSHVHLDPQ